MPGAGQNARPFADRTDPRWPHRRQATQSSPTSVINCQGTTAHKLQISTAEHGSELTALLS